MWKTSVLIFGISGLPALEYIIYYIPNLPLMFTIATRNCEPIHCTSLLSSAFLDDCNLPMLCQERLCSFPLLFLFPIVSTWLMPLLLPPGCALALIPFSVMRLLLLKCSCHAGWFQKVPCSSYHTWPRAGVLSKVKWKSQCLPKWQVFQLTLELKYYLDSSALSLACQRPRGRTPNTE